MDGQPPKFSGKKLKAARLAAGLSQMALCVEVGISSPTVLRRWEADEYDPHVNTACKLAHVLGVSLDDLTEAS